MFFFVNGNKYELFNWLNNKSYVKNGISQSKNVRLRTGLLYEEENSVFMYNKKTDSWIKIM